jgi:hypothetical protein
VRPLVVWQRGVLNDVAISFTRVSAPGLVQTLLAEQTGNGALRPVAGLQLAVTAGVGTGGGAGSSLPPPPLPQPAKSNAVRIHIRFTMPTMTMVLPQKTIFT